MRHKPFTAELQAGQAPRHPAADPAPAATPYNGDDRIGAILEGIARLERRLGSPPDSGLPISAVTPGSDPRLQETLRQVAGLTAATGSGDDRITAAGRELDAIVAATEAATQTILAAAETIETVVEEVSAIAGSPVIGQQLTEVTEAVTQIFQASTFQDITGQRIAKVVATLDFVEERVRCLANLWADPRADPWADPWAELGAPPPPAAPASAAEPDVTGADDGLLEGPQLDNRGITQAEIDALFD